MPSYDQLDNEVWWTKEYEPAPLARFNSRLRARYGLTRSQCGSKGDNVHLRGRHRSRNWCLNSQFCTNRSYATTDARDKRGPGDALRATDLGLQGPELWAVCRRVDAAVRAGRLPQLAEWFGTFDGKTVVGWSNGRPATSDGSHLYHGHFGYWTESVEDTAFFDLLYEIVTGDDMALRDEKLQLPAETLATGQRVPATGDVEQVDGATALAYALRNAYAGRVTAEAVLALLGNGTPVTLTDADREAIIAGVVAELRPAIEALRGGIEADTRDAVADLGEGGAAAVRADE